MAEDEFYEEESLPAPRLGRPGGAPPAPRGAKKAAPKKAPAPAGGLGRPSMPSAATPAKKKAAAPRLGGGGVKTAAEINAGLRGGWAEGRRVLDSTSTFTQNFNPEKGTTYFVKFQEDGPYASYGRHWVKRVSPTGGSSNRPYICLASPGIDRECPLCGIGDRAQATSAFNIVLVDDDGALTHKSWDCGARIFNKLEAYAKDSKNGPLPKRYYMVMKSGTKGGGVDTSVSPIPASILKDEYDIEPPTAEALARVELYDVSVLEIPKVAELREIAAELMEENSDPDAEGPEYDED